MAAIFKMAENWFFDHNSVSCEYYCGLFSDLRLHFNWTYFIEEKFLSDSRWRLMSTFFRSVDF
jgi:hypothetical protein